MSIRAKFIVQVSISFHGKCLSIQGHSTGVAIVVISPVVAIDMELTVVEVKVSSPSLVANLPQVHCRFILSLALLYVSAVFYGEKLP